MNGMSTSCKKSKKLMEAGLAVSEDVVLVCAGSRESSEPLISVVVLKRRPAILTDV